MNRKQKKVLIRIIIAAILMIVLYFLPLDEILHGKLKLLHVPRSA